MSTLAATAAPSPRALLRGAAALLVAASMLAAPRAIASDNEQSGWLAWFNNTALTPDFGLISDVQVRSRDEWTGVRNLLVRPGLSWFAAPGHTFSAGYAYIGTYPEGAPAATEHRTWQQYVFSRALSFGSVSQRLRLEQRFIGRNGADDLYSDRLRWFGRAVLPLDGAMPFRHGAFVALQNEVFLNLSARDELNARTLDQNRAYVALGWRLSPTTDVEIGYLNQWTQRRNGDTVNHILQVALYTQLSR